MTELPPLDKCKLQRYINPNAEPPLEFETVGEIEFADTDEELGFMRVFRMRRACEHAGFQYLFWSTCEDEGYLYSIVVE